MNTQTHILIACALFSKSGKENRARNWAVFCGALAPDILIFFMFGWAKLTGTPEKEVWTNWYYNPPWQTWIDGSNAFIFYIGLLIFALILPKIIEAGKALASLITVFSLAALIHLLCDLPLHVDDGHAHFWPLSHWRYHSPVSYWDHNHYGHYFMVFEALLGIGLCIILWRRFNKLWIRLLLALCLIPYIVLPIMFMT